jgi:hypothetical protein
MSNLSYLERMRHYRGSDDAVKITGNRDNLTGMLSNPNHALRDKLTTEIMTCYSGAAYGDKNWSKFTGGWTTPEVPTIYGDFREQYGQLAQLSLDPGLITHLPEFIEFLKSYDSPINDYLAVREDFKRHLGDRTVWRGMMISDEDAARIKQEGIESSFLRGTKDMPALIENFEANVLSVFFSELVEQHFHLGNYHSPLVSVTSHEDLAMAVGKYFGKKSPGNELYLFKIRIPEIDLMYYTDHAIRRPSKLEPHFSGEEREISISVNGKKSVYHWDRHTESYILHKINPDEILDISKPSVTQSSWQG